MSNREVNNVDTTDTQSPVEYCYTDCKFERKHVSKAKMLRCLFCSDWFHIKCDKKAEEDINGFTCASCRQITGNVKNMVSAMASTLLKLDTMTTVLAQMKDNQGRISRDIGEIKSANDKTAQENALLKHEILTLRAELHERKWQGFGATAATAKRLVVGSSVLRDIENESLENTTVLSISGGKIANVKDTVSNVKKDEYASLTFLVGGNDIEETEDIEKIVTEYKDMITLAKEKTSNVTVASILPRICPANTNQIMDKIDAINANLQQTCEQLSVTFVDNNDSFRLRDGTINDGYFLKERYSDKQVHLNDKGTEKLCQNLNIKAKKGMKITKDRQSRQRPQGDRAPPARQNRNVSGGPQPAPTPAPNSKPSDNSTERNNQAPGQWARAQNYSRPPVDVSARPQQASHWSSDNTNNGYNTHNTHGYYGDIYRNEQNAAPQDRGYQNEYYNRMPQTQESQYNRGYTTQEARCEYCGEAGHSYTRCWYQQPIQCKLCYAYGHKEKNCTNARDNRSNY